MIVITVNEFKVVNIEGKVDPTGSKILERGQIKVDIDNVICSCDISLICCKYLNPDSHIVFGEATSSIDRALESALSVINEDDIARIVIEIEGNLVHDDLNNLVKFECECRFKIISNGKRAYEYNPEEILDIGRNYKTLSSQLISSQPNLSRPILISSFELLHKAIKWLDLIKPDELENESEAYTLLKRQCYNNASFLQLKLNCPEGAEKSSSYVLKEDQNNIKALYRRAVANTKLQNYELAKDDLNNLLKIEPTNKQAREQMNIVENKIKLLDDKYALAMKKFLNI